MPEQPDWMRWNPYSAYNDFRRLQDEVGRFLGFGPSGTGPDLLLPGQAGKAISAGWGPSVDLRETENEVIATVEVPGVEPGELDVEIDADSFSIKGEVRHEAQTQEKGIHRVERRYGTFQRTVPFPVAVKDDEAKANYRNGVLEIRAPKAQTGRGRRKLQIDGDRPVH